MSSECILLTLPREVRDEIYLAVLRTPIDPPPSPKEGGLRLRAGDVLYPLVRNRGVATMPLSQCNSQIRQELSELSTTRAFSSRHLSCELDVMVNCHAMWPTWTRPPFSTAQMRSLNVNVRLFTTPSSPVGRSLFWGKYEPISRLATFFSLLDSFIHDRPEFVCPGLDVGALDIDELTVNFFSPHSAYEDFEQGGVWVFMETAAAGPGLLSEKVHRLRLCHGEETREYDMWNEDPRQSNHRKRLMRHYILFSKWGDWRSEIDFEKTESSELVW